jgi:hypothetical protein
MAGKFHINPETGKAGRCTASTKPCKYGERAEHYESVEAAATAYEKNMNSEVLSTLSKGDLRDPRIDRVQLTASSVYTLSETLSEESKATRNSDDSTANILAKASAMIDEVVENQKFSTADEAERAVDRFEDLQLELNRLANNAETESEASAWFRASEGLADKIYASN